MEPNQQGQGMGRGTVITIIIIVIIIVVAVIWAISASNSGQGTQSTAPLAGQSNQPGVEGTSTSPTAPKTVTVNLTDNGFSPSSITINAGDTIKFINQSSGRMWVASNPHPTHTDYPGFDEKTAVGSGDSYSFTFTRPGTWGYHNHITPTVQGTIVVVNTTNKG